MRVATCTASIACSIALAALVAAPAAGADRDGGGELVVSPDGVSFDPSRLLGDDGWFGYTVTRLDGSGPRYLGDVYSREDSSDGHLSFDVRGGSYEGGYCITWAHLTGVHDQFATWAGDEPTCTGTAEAPEPVETTEPEPPAVAPSREPVDPADRPETDAATAPDDAGAGTGRSTADVPPPTAPAPEPAAPAATATSTPQETDSPAEAPTTTEPTSDVTTGPEDRVSAGTGRLLLSGERAAPPPPAASGFPTLAVVGLGGIAAAAAGGAMLLMRRAR